MYTVYTGSVVRLLRTATAPVTNSKRRVKRLGWTHKTATYSGQRAGIRPQNPRLQCMWFSRAAELGRLS